MARHFDYDRVKVRFEGLRLRMHRLVLLPSANSNLTLVLTLVLRLASVFLRRIAGANMSIVTTTQWLACHTPRDLTFTQDHVHHTAAALGGGVYI